MTDLEKQFKKWLKLSEKVVHNGYVYYILDAELLTEDEMYNYWIKNEYNKKGLPL